MALWGRRINNFLTSWCLKVAFIQKVLMHKWYPQTKKPYYFPELEFWCLVASGGLHFCVSSTSFEKNDIGWPQQPLTEKVSDISKKLDFWWFIPWKGTGIGHLDVKDDQTIRISNFFDEMRLLRSLRPLRLLMPLRSLRLQKFKALKTTTEDFRVIQTFEFSFISMFWKKVFWVKSWNIILNFCTFSLRGCWGQLMSCLEGL